MGSAVAVALLLIALAAGAATEAQARGHPAGSTPAARFWAQALPDTPMPAAIADLVQRGTDHSPLTEHLSAAIYSASIPLQYVYCASAVLHIVTSAVEGLFFRESEMRVGGAMTVSLPASSPAAFLPRAAADRIPFGNLTYTLGAFGIAPGSDEADQVSDTLRGCSAPGLAGEEKACATSLEGVVLTATRMLATTRHGQIVAAASALPSDGLPRGEYAVQAVTPLVGSGGSSRFVACHPMPYPYVVYACHMTVRSSSAYVVSIRRGAEPSIAMAAVCHFDTSNWNPDHPAFEALHTKPGGSPVCHFMPYANVVFGADTGVNGAVAEI